jgi:hypothetical protein
MMSMNAIHVHAVEGRKHGKFKATLPLRHMITYEWCMKVCAMLNLNYIE